MKEYDNLTVSRGATIYYALTDAMMNLGLISVQTEDVLDFKVHKYFWDGE